MSLAIRLLLGFGVLAVFVTALVGVSARDASRREVEKGFEERVAAATAGAREEIVWDAEELSGLLTPLCKLDSFVSRTVSDLQRARGTSKQLSPGVAIAIQEIVPEQRKALRLDQLVLVTGEGLILGTDDLAQVGRQSEELASLLKKKPGQVRLVKRGKDALMQVHCVRQGKGVDVGLVAARKIDPVLARVGRAYGVSLRRGDATGPELRADVHQRVLQIKEIPGLQVTAAVSRQPLLSGRELIDRSIFFTGAIALLISVALAVFVARGLSQPIVELAQQTREVIRGNPHPVRARGGRELGQLARSFNRTIDELTVMRRRLARTERIAARREVARQVAHEIKNPLAPIQAAVETLRRLRDRESPRFDEYFDEATTIVLGEVQRIKNIVTQFTKFARLPPPQFARIDAGEAVRSVAALHDGRDSGGPRVELHIQNEKSIPLLLADRDQLVQVLTNLVQNGIEAASAERGDPQVVIELRMPDEHHLLITVSDNGPGIDPEVRERLFEPYVSTKEQGTGLGLAIAQRIAYEHGGEICCVDPKSPGSGAVLELWLPVDGPPLLERPPTDGTTGPVTISS